LFSFSKLILVSTSFQCAIIERIPTSLKVDLQKRRCLDVGCVRAGTLPFANIAILSQHLVSSWTIERFLL
jgi:hypothetical protein